MSTEAVRVKRAASLVLQATPEKYILAHYLCNRDVIIRGTAVIEPGREGTIISFKDGWFYGEGEGTDSEGTISEEEDEVEEPLNSKLELLYGPTTQDLHSSKWRRVLEAAFGLARARHRKSVNTI